MPPTEQDRPLFVERRSVPLLLAFCLVACGPEREAASPGGTLVVALLGDVDSWNPYTTREATSAGVLDLLYPRLIRETGLDGHRSTLEPWLAESWSFSNDRRRLTFRLRADAVWSDGRAVTCEDVRYTLDAQRSDELAWPGASLKERILGVDCPEPRTAIFRFAEPYPEQILDANDDAVVAAAYREVPMRDWRSTAWQERAVTCGPFRLASVTPGQEAVLERDRGWWDASEVRLDRVILRVFPDQTAAFLRFLDGDVDVLQRVPPLRAREVEARPGFRLAELPALAYTYIGWNVLAPDAYREDRRRRGCSGEGTCPESGADILRLQRQRPHPMLADPRVRRALTLAVDRRDLVDGLWAGHAHVGASPIVSALWAHDPSAALPFDPARATSLLDEAGWTDADRDGVREKRGRRFELRAIVNAENQTRRDALERVAASLGRIGVRLVPDALPRAEYVARARDKDFDGVLGAWRAGTRVDMEAIFHTRAAASRGNNLTAWSARASDDLLDRAARAATRDEALPLWREWQAVFQEEQPYTVLYEETVLVGLGARVRGPTGTGLNPLDDLHRWWVATESRASIAP